MSTDPEVYVRGELTNQLHRVDIAVVANDFVQVQRLLNAAYQIAGDIPVLREEVVKKDEEIKQIRHSRLGEKLLEVERLLGQPDLFDEGRCGQLLDEAYSIDPEESRIQTLRDQVAREAPRLHEIKIYEETRQQCEALWQQEQELLAKNTPLQLILDHIFSKSIHLAKEALETYPESLILNGLLQTAEIKLSNARTRYDAKNTADKTGDWKRLIDRLANESDPDTLFPWSEDGQPPSTISVREARIKAKEFADAYAEKKANEYLAKARDYMDDHAPRAARDELEKRKSLFLLNPETNAQLEFYLRETVKPALEQVALAEKELQYAEKENSPVQAWERLEKASDIYPWVPRLDEVRGALLPRLAMHAEGLLKQAKDAIREHDPESAQERAKQSLEWGERIVFFAEQYGNEPLLQRGQVIVEEGQRAHNQAEAAERLDKQIAEEAQKMEALLKTNPGQAVREWELLVEQLGEETVERVTRLQKLRREIEAIKGISSFLARMNSAFESNDAVKIGNALNEIEQEVQKPANEDFRSELESSQHKLLLRRSYQLAVQLRTQGDLEEALQLFDQVAGDMQHPDAAPAKESADAIRSDTALKARVASALKNAHAALEKNEPREAYEILQPVAQLPSLEREEIRTLMSEARQRWATQLVERIDVELSRSRVRSERLRALANEVQNILPEPRPLDSAEHALAAAASAEAALHEKADEWQEAAQLWQEALSYDRMNPDYKLKLQNAQKQIIEIALIHAAGEGEVRGLFDTLERQIPFDPEIRIRRAGYYLNQVSTGRIDIETTIRYYAEARTSITEARDLLERQGKSANEVLKGRAKDLLQKVIEGELLAQAQGSVERKLRVKSSLAEYGKAKDEAASLLRAHPDNVTLRDWWHLVLEQTIERLANDPKTVSSKAEDIWQRFDQRSKILVLNPDHVYAQELLHELPQRAQDIAQQTDRLYNDRHQGLTTVSADVDDLDVLQEQDIQLRSLTDQARAVYDMLQGFENLIQDQVAKSYIGILSKKLENLTILETQLGELLQLKAQAVSFMGQAKVDGKWQQFDDIATKIDEKGYAAHRTFQALKREKLVIQKKRDSLQQLYEQLAAAVKQEQFLEANKLVNLLENDSQVGDPQDLYGLRSRIEIETQGSHQKITNWRALKNWLKDRMEQLAELRTWIYFAGAPDLIQQAKVDYVPPPEGAPQGTVEWHQVEVEIDTLLDQGKWNEAKQKIRLTVEGNNGHYNNELLALRTAEQYLKTPPISIDQAFSTQATRLLQAAVAYRQNSIQPQLSSARSKYEELKTRRSRWESAYPELEQALNTLNHLDNLWWWQKRKRKEEIDEAVTRTRAALANCREIAPQHSNLQGIESHHLLTS